MFGKSISLGWVVIILALASTSCRPKPEFFINGKGYYTRKYCIKSHLEHETGYHWGIRYSFTDGEFKSDFHLPIHCFSTCKKVVCDLEKIDTIEIK